MGVIAPERCKGNAHNDQSPEFATGLYEATQNVGFFWHKDGGRGSSVYIRKDLHLDIGGKNPHAQGAFVTAFFVYNNCMYERTVRDHGCKVNVEPYYTYAEAKARADEEVAAVIASGLWEAA